MASITIDRDTFPGKSDAEIAAVIARECGCSVVIRYKNSPDARQFTNFGLCPTEEHIQGYLRSPHCHEAEIVYDRRRALSDESQEGTTNTGYAKALVESASIVQLEYPWLFQVNKDAATIAAVMVEVIDAIRQLLPSTLYKGRPEDLLVREKGFDPANGPYMATVASQTLIDDMMATLQRTRRPVHRSFNNIVNNPLPLYTKINGSDGHALSEETEPADFAG